MGWGQVERVSSEKLGLGLNSGLGQTTSMNPGCFFNHTKEVIIVSTSLGWCKITWGPPITVPLIGEC